MLHFPRQELLESTNPKGGRERSTTAAQQREKCRRKSKNSPPRHFGASKQPGQSLAAAARASNTAWHLGELLCSSAWRTDGSELRDPERTGCTARSISSISQRSVWCHAVLSQRERLLRKGVCYLLKGAILPQGYWGVEYSTWQKFDPCDQWSMSLSFSTTLQMLSAEVLELRSCTEDVLKKIVH